MDVPRIVKIGRSSELSIGTEHLPNLPVLPIANLHRVPDSVPDEMAVFTEPLAAALEIQDQIQIKPTDRVLLVGAGRLGQLIAQTLALTGCDLRVVARHDSSAEVVESSAGFGSSPKKKSSPGDGMSWWKRPGRQAAFR